jgi:D-galactarolactone cycloisomerase
MQIRDVRVHVVSIPLERPFWMSLEPYRTASEIVVELETDDGLVGIGTVHGRPLDQIGRILTGPFAEVVRRHDALAHAAIWDELFRYAHSRAGATLGESHGQPHFGSGARPQVMAAIAGIDIALWDLAGKALGLPVYRLLGGEDPRVPAYASGGYYGPDGGADPDGLIPEMLQYAGMGYRAVKMKVGGLSIETDVARVRAVREAVGETVDIMLDANMAYDVPEAIRAARAYEAFAPRWLEEPVRWYDSVDGTGQVAQATRIPIASGESELHRWGCRDLIGRGGVRVMQFDATRAGGVTEWLRVAAYAAAHGVVMAPHHDPQVHGHLLAAVPNGHILETFPNRARDPLSAALYLDAPQVSNGVYTVSDRPGFGVTLNPAALQQYGTRL